MTLIMFTNWMHWQECMDMCPKYQGAHGVTFSDQRGMQELIDWAFKVSTDPQTGQFYEDDGY